MPAANGVTYGPDDDDGWRTTENDPGWEGSVTLRDPPRAATVGQFLCPAHACAQ